MFNDYYKNKKVLVTGHTGFKGTWLTNILLKLGAEVVGYSLSPKESPNLFNLLEMDKKIISIIGDIRDFSNLKATIEKFRPEIIIHMAAQPLVRESYLNPKDTYEINVLGTLNILEVIRNINFVKSFLNVTTDKVYLNKEWIWPYRENDELNGFDPYSNSKSCSELITSAYKNSFFHNHITSISTARSGNVIGGGDFAKDRIIPDCVRALTNNSKVILRNPNSTRPYLHVLDTLFAYLLIAFKQALNPSKSGSYNIGPENSNYITNLELVSSFCSYFDNLKWDHQADKNPVHEANILKLDSSKIRNELGWSPNLSISDAIKLSADWTKYYIENPTNTYQIVNKQIDYYISKFSN